MERETKDFDFKVEAAQEDGKRGYIEGYASTFGNIDLGNDIVESGAFKRTINDKNGKFPILLDHDPRQHCGWNLEATEDSKGLKVKGEINLTRPEVQTRFELAKRAKEIGTKIGLSIGYETLKQIVETQKNGKPPIRRLKELNLHEYSFVTFPMNERAGVHHAKSDDLRALLDLMKCKGITDEEILMALSKPMKAAAPETDSHFLRSVDEKLNQLKETIKGVRKAA